jgi:tRNA uridine 5-carboxymethylaminomethyl modification enzyme
VKIEAHYAGYLNRQQADIDAYRRDEALELPKDIDYDQVAGFSNEVREKLARHGPATLGAAARIPGITPAALTILLAHVRRGKRRAVA